MVCVLLLPQGQTPVFRGSTDVVVVDVQVTGRSGAPIPDLALADFALKVDGRPRPISSVVFQRTSDRPAASNAPAFATLSDPNPIQADSFVLFVVDPVSMRTVPSRSLFDQAAALMSTLPAAHAVGLMIVPARIPQFPFSTVRQPMAAALKQQMGTLGDNTTQSERMAMAVATQDALDRGIDVLRAVDGRRTLVYVADSLIVNVEEIVDRAREADVTIDIIASDKPVIADVTGRRPPAPPPVTGGDFGAASAIADRTGGWLLRRFTLGSNVLPRLERTLSAQYVLTFNVESSDHDGRPHQIDVKVNRKDADVQFRKEFVR